MHHHTPAARRPRPRHALALAAALAACAGGASAQSSVVVYGIADAYLRAERGSNGTAHTVGSGLSRGSRFGFRINEDLGGGLQAMAVLESGLNLDDGQMLASGSTGTGFGRQAFIALGGARTGLVALGRQYTPIFALSAGSFDPFGANYLGTINASQGLQGGLTSRASNAVSYTYNYATALDSPTPRNGFSLAGLVAAGENTGPRQYGMAVGYGQDRWFAGYGNHVVRGTATSTSPKQTSHVVGGTYRFDALMLFAALHRTRNDAAPATQIDRANWSLGTRIPVPTGQVIAQYQRSDDRRPADRDVSNFSIAYEHFFSKRTIGYVNYGRNNNAPSSSATLYLGTVTVDAGHDPSALAVGMRHHF